MDVFFPRARKCPNCDTATSRHRPSVFLYMSLPFAVSSKLYTLTSDYAFYSFSDRGVAHMHAYDLLNIPANFDDVPTVHLSPDVSPSPFRMYRARFNVFLSMTHLETLNKDSKVSLVISSRRKLAVFASRRESEALKGATTQPRGRRAGSLVRSIRGVQDARPLSSTTTTPPLRPHHPSCPSHPHSHTSTTSRISRRRGARPQARHATTRKWPRQWRSSRVRRGLRVREYAPCTSILLTN